MKARLLSISTFIFLVLTPGLVTGGNEGSGGSDYFRPLRAWFLSQDPAKHIRACYDVKSGFGVSHQELAEMVRSAFGIWGEYIHVKQLSAHLPPNSLNIISKVDLYPICDGNEDLKFYFGSDDMKVVKAKIQYNKPFGFAELNSDVLPQAAWSPGFIWISNTGTVFADKGIPAWPAAKNALRALILHEVGHVFGNGHVEDTVMTIHLGKFLTADTSPARPELYVSAYNRIDSIVELIPCIECSVSYSAPRQFDGTQATPGMDDLSNAFRMLTGKEPEEPLSAIFTRGENQKIDMSFIDGSGTNHFPISVLTRAASKADNVPLFNGLGGKNFFSFGASYYGEIQPLSGTKIPVSINYNMDRRKVAIIPLGIDLNPRPLFVAVP